MKTIAAVIFALFFLAADSSGAPRSRIAEKTVAASNTENQTIERRLAVDPNVSVTMCLASGDVVVHGWDKSEVRAVSATAASILLRAANVSGASSATSRVEVVVSDSGNGNIPRRENNCAALSNVELNVPRGATVELKTTSGDIRIEDVGEAHTQTVSGTTHVVRLNKGFEAISVSGDIQLEDSSGAVRLRSVSGTIDARGLSASSANDDLDVKSTSGGINLERIGHARVEAVTVSGRIGMTGALARGGRYRFRTISGDIDLLLPSNASFQFDARVSHGGDIVFVNLPFKFTGDASPTASRLVNGFFGTGDASLSLSSFSGTLRLRRQ